MDIFLNINIQNLQNIIKYQNIIKLKKYVQSDITKSFITIVKNIIDILRVFKYQ